MAATFGDYYGLAQQRQLAHLPKTSSWFGKRPRQKNGAIATTGFLFESVELHRYPKDLSKPRTRIHIKRLRLGSADLIQYKYSINAWGVHSKHFFGVEIAKTTASSNDGHFCQSLVRICNRM
jgi:hypothetical protein